MKKDYLVHYPDLNESIEKIAIKLLEAKENGSGLYCDMSGLAIMGVPGGVSLTRRICSDDVNTVDDVYKAITGMGVDEYHNKLSEIREKARLVSEQRRILMEAKDNEIIENIPNILDKGSNYVYPDKVAEWQIFVEENSNSDSGRLYIDSVFQIMEALAGGKNIEKCKELFDSFAFSGAIVNRVKDMVLQFSPRGLEFYKGVSTKREMLSSMKKIVMQMKENKNREKGQTSLGSK